MDKLILPFNINTENKYLNPLANKKFIDFFGLLFLISSLSLIGCKEQSTTQRTRINFNKDWQFLKMDGENPSMLNLSDPNWRPLDLPHDWAIEGPFTQEVGYKGGYLPYPGTAWYQKTFNVTKGENRVKIEFEGVMRNAKIWLNGDYIGGWPYGYTSFAFDLTDKIKRETENRLIVRVENEDKSSRWYPGSGIYRNVWLTYTNPVHVAHWGTYVATPSIKKEEATVKVTTDIQNQSDKEVIINLKTIVENAAGGNEGTHLQQTTIPANSQIELKQDLVIKNPKLWDLETPYLYKAITEVLQDNQVIDRYETPFGIRDFHFDANKGFFLNGKSIKLQGVNLHHGLGPLGAAVNKRATERQLEIMKDMGVNAIRTAHNPPSIEQLDLCDQMGILVIDETFDTWSEPKWGVEKDYSIWFDEWAIKDTEALIKRDRNHPSIIAWSIGNEVMNLGTKEGKQAAKEMAAVCRELDPSRPVTAGIHLTIEFDAELAEIFDVFGMNYWQDRYEKLHEQFPEMPLVASESAATLSSRGAYHFPVKEVYSGWQDVSKQISSYDLVNTGFGTLPDTEFDLQKAPWLAGQFVWSGFDYHGEPDPYETGSFPAHSSYFGIVDMCGFKKDRYYLYQSQWTDKPMIHLLPHWNWPDRIGQTTPVYIYSNCAAVELFVNGKSQGKKQQAETNYRFKWENINYQPGSIQAIGYDENGHQLCEKTINTAGAPYKIELQADRPIIQADGTDVAFVTVKIVDKAGNLCPTANNLVNFELAGEGKIFAVGNGDPTCIESYQAPKRSAFNGLCLLMVQSTEKTGEIKVMATAEGLEQAALTVQSK